MTDHGPNQPEVSVVVPLHREADQLEVVVDTIAGHLGRTGGVWELILVDDGSPDGTWDAIQTASARHPGVRGIRLSRRFGKEAALCAGLDAARGRAVVVMDGDLQHPPALIPEMVGTWRRGEAQIVEAVKESRGRESLKSKLMALTFYRVLNALAGVDLRGASDFKLMDRQVVKAWLRMNERHVFFRGMVAWLGFSRVEVSFHVPERLDGGSSRWSLLGLTHLALTAITAFSSKLLHIVSIFGVLFLMLAFVLGAQTLYLKFTGRAISGFSTVNLLLLITGSLLMISLGVIGLYLSRIYDEVKARPRYLVSETLEEGAEQRAQGSGFGVETGQRLTLTETEQEQRKDVA